MKKRLLSLLVLLMTAVTGAWATLPEKVYYRVYDYSDGKLTYTDNEIAGTGVTEVTNSTTEWADGTYVVTATTTISSRITVTGTVNLIILDGATLTAEKGITVSDDNTLNIYMGNSSNSIQSTGQLNATAVEAEEETINMETGIPVNYDIRGAGIGGYLVLEMESGPIIEKIDCGNVNIHGGKINVQNESKRVAGIGGAEYGTGGNITIYYSKVTAYGNELVSAIGAGKNGSGGTVAIYGGNVNAIVTNIYNTTTPGIGASLTVGKDVQVYALSGSKSPDEDLSDDTNVAPEGGGQVTTFNSSMFTRYTGPAPAPPVAGYGVALKSGTEDATKWQGKAGTGDYQALPLTGVEAGTAVSFKYFGTKKVESVKAVKKAALIVNPEVGQIIGSDGKNYDANATLPDGVTAVAMIAYVGGDAETSTTYNHGLALALEDVSVTKTWCSQTDATCLGTQYTIGTKFNDLAGIANTDALVNHTGHTHAAASAARGYNGGTHPTGTSAWFLPSAGQWNKMATAATGYANLQTNAGLEDAGYWSSTELNANYAWDFDFDYGSWLTDDKDYGCRVRACLAF